MVVLPFSFLYAKSLCLFLEFVLRQSAVLCAPEEEVLNPDYFVSIKMHAGVDSIYDAG